MQIAPEKWQQFLQSEEAVLSSENGLETEQLWNTEAVQTEAWQVKRHDYQSSKLTRICQLLCTREMVCPN